MNSLPTPPPSPIYKNYTPLESVNHDRIGQIINHRLQIVGELGIGAYGVVYTAVDILDPARRTYAVKALRKQGLEPRQQRFQDLEIDLHRTASSSGHPNIVQFVQIMEDDENKYVILEYCPEGDLFSNITDRGRYVRNDALAKSVFLQIIDAVMHCHSLEIYHRDLKPENILVTEGGSCVKLADFGLATTDRITSDYGCGSTFYMSPECQQSSPRPYASYASAPNDVWSLGVILVNLTCGRNPWKRACSDDSTYSAYLKDRSFLKTILPITDELNHILSMIFDPDPSTRITLPVLRQVISECLKFTMSPQSPVSVMPSTSTPPSQYDQIMPPTDQFPCKQPNQLPPSPPYTPPHTPPLTTTSVPSWTVHNTAPSISDYQSGCTELGTVFSNAASRSPILQQSTFAIVQPIPTKVTAYPPTQYVLPSGYQYWFPQHISRMAGYFHQPFQQHLQYMAPVPVC